MMKEAVLVEELECVNKVQGRRCPPVYQEA